MRSHVSKYIPAAGFLCAALIGSTAGAANLTVNSLADVDAAGDGECTLREAISNADGDTDITGGDCAAGAGADSITFSLSGTIVLGSTLPTIRAAAGLTLNGAGQSITVSGNDAVQVMSVASGATLNLQYLTVANGNRGAVGGGIGNMGALTISHCSFTGNIARYGSGIGSYGIVSIENSSFTGNSAEFYGGVIWTYGGTLTIDNSTFTGNSAAYGGALFNNNSTATVSNSSFIGNSARVWGGGILNYTNSTAIVSNSTFSGNTSAYEGGASTTAMAAPSPSAMALSPATAPAAAAASSPVFTWAVPSI